MFNKLPDNKRRTKFTALAAIVFMTSAYADLPDPTRPPNASLTGSSAETDMADNKIFLSSILISPERRVAVINGKALRKGDQVGAGKIVKINPSEVVLKVGKDTEILSLLPKALKLRTRKTGYE